MPLSPGIDRLRRLLFDTLATGDQHAHCIIRETDPNSAIQSVILDLGIGDWLVFSPDQGRNIEKDGKVIAATMSPLLRVNGIDNEEELYHHRACDAVLIKGKEIGSLQYEVGIVFIEVKSAIKHHTEKAKLQFQSTRCFIHYLIKIAEEFYGFKFSLKESYVTLYPGSMDIKPTRRDQEPIASGSLEKPRLISIRSNHKVRL
jgi:hypothetical protein